MNNHDLPVIPMEMWTHHIIPAIMRQRFLQTEQVVHCFGNMLSASTYSGFFPSTFTLTALKRTCKLFNQDIRISQLVDIIYVYWPDIYLERKGISP